MAPLLCAVKHQLFGVENALQGRIQEFKKGGVLLKEYAAEHAEKFRVTTPTFPNHAHFN